MNIESLIIDRINSAPKVKPKPAVVKQAYHPSLNNPPGYPVSEGKSLTFPPDADTGMSVVTYKVTYEMDNGRDPISIEQEQGDFKISSNLSARSQFWWHVGSLVASQFLGRGGNTCSFGCRGC